MTIRLPPIPPELLTPRNMALAGGGVLVVLLVLIMILLRHRKPRRDESIQYGNLDILTANLRDKGPISPDALQGGLRHMPLPDLLQFLAQGRRTGALEINSGRRAGSIQLVQGMVLSAEYRRTNDLDALFEMLSLETGDFVFTPTPPPDYPVNGREVVDILMLWLSRKDAAK